MTEVESKKLRTLIRIYGDCCVGQNEADIDKSWKALISFIGETVDVNYKGTVYKFETDDPGEAKAMIYAHTYSRALWDISNALKWIPDRAPVPSVHEICDEIRGLIPYHELDI